LRSLRKKKRGSGRKRKEKERELGGGYLLQEVLVLLELGHNVLIQENLDDHSGGLMGKKDGFELRAENQGVDKGKEKNNTHKKSEKKKKKKMREGIITRSWGRSTLLASKRSSVAVLSPSETYLAKSSAGSSTVARESLPIHSKRKGEVRSR
jgi:hypothetical protein